MLIYLFKHWQSFNSAAIHYPSRRSVFSNNSTNHAQLHIHTYSAVIEWNNCKYPLTKVAVASLTTCSSPLIPPSLTVSFQLGHLPLYAFASLVAHQHISFLFLDGCAFTRANSVNFCAFPQAHSCCALTRTRPFGCCAARFQYFSQFIVDSCCCYFCFYTLAFYAFSFYLLSRCVVVFISFCFCFSFLQFASKLLSRIKELWQLQQQLSGINSSKTSATTLLLSLIYSNMAPR